MQTIADLSLEKLTLYRGETAYLDQTAPPAQPTTYHVITEGAPTIETEAVYPRLGVICSLFRRRPSHKQPGLRRRSSPPTSSGPSENLCTDGFQL